jgi:VCBS repeat-containing protein
MAGTPTRVDKDQIEDVPFDGSTGHEHTGAVGDAPKLPLIGLSDVDSSGLEDGDTLIYDSGTGNWVASAPEAPGGSGLQARTTASFTSDSLAEGATDSGKQLPIGKCVSVLKIQTSRPAWVRVYSTPAHQTADAARSQTADPTGEHGVLLEVITTSGNLTLDLNPAAMVFSLDGGQTENVNVTVKNLDSSAGTVVVTVTFVHLEG